GRPPPPGAPVRVFGILNPPPPPASPGAYDFGRNAYFQGLGGTLFALGETRPAQLEPPPWRVRVMSRVTAARSALGGRIVAGLGGPLFALGETRPAQLEPPPWRVRMIIRVNAVRYALAERIVARLGVRTGGVAAAMTTGHETWIQDPDLDAMRDSGLAHILSI